MNEHKRLNERERLCGEAVIDFANAESTDEACSKYFEYLQSDLTFAQEAREAFPFLATLPPPSELEAEILGQTREEVKKYLPKGFEKEKAQREYNQVVSLHESIRETQNNLKNILEKVVQGVRFCDIEEMQEYQEMYGKIPHANVRDNGDFLELCSGISEDEFLDIPGPDYWPNRLDYFLADWLITFFLNRRAKEYLHKCEECGAYFLARKLYVSERSFCPKTKCKMTWSNRHRILSGKAREYKKKKRSEGKYQ